MNKLLIPLLPFALIFAKQKPMIDHTYKKFHSYANPLYSPWLCDEEFIKINNSYKVPCQNIIFEEGRYLQYKLALLAAKIPQGDFIECGVYKGKSLDIFASVLDLYDQSGKIIYGVDSFEGLSDPDIIDIDVRTNKHFFHKGMIKGFDIDTINQYLSHHKCEIHLIKGWIPNILQELENKSFCFAHIDVDLLNPTRDSLNFIYPRLVKGAIVLFDDYGFPMCIGARKAIDAFMKDKLEVLIPIPTGQAFFIKQ